MEPLFIEELGAVVGGGCTAAGTSTGQSTLPNGPLSTQAIGEDGNPPFLGGGTLSPPVVGANSAPSPAGQLSTQAIGEDGNPPVFLPGFPASGK
jgi:hypothetical protein